MCVTERRTTTKEELKIISFFVRVFEWLVNTESMDKALPIVKKMHIVFNFEKMTEQCKGALKVLEESVNTFIAGSSKCTTKDLSCLLTKVLSTIKDVLVRYCNTKTSHNGVNNMSILKNSTSLLS